MEKDDIIIRKAIVHILDSFNGYMGLSEKTIDLGPDLYEFFRGHIFKLIASDDTQKCRFNMEDSPVYKALEELDEKDDNSFINTSQKIGEALFDVMCESMEIPSADFVVVSYQIESQVHIALLKMNYKETYIHMIGENSQNNIIKQKITLPNDSSKLSEAVDINLEDYAIKLVEKKYEINGEKIDYLSEKFLLCHTNIAPKKKLNILTKVINDINNKFEQENVDSKLKSKSLLQQEYVEKKEFNINELGDKLFGDNPVKRQEFDEKLEKYDLQYDNFTVENENTVKKLQKQVLVTDTGIEITIPMEEYNTKDNIEVITQPGGSTTIIIKNIEKVNIR